MSKFLKFIVHFIVICTILCVLGLALPPFFGVTTEIMDDSTKETNLPMGSVTYAIPQKTAEVEVGTPILVQEDSKVYRYNIATLNLENGTGTVTDPTVSGAETITVAVKDYVPKVVVTIGLVGYLLVATQSVEGLIILGLAVLFLIILYVIAELWRKEPREESDYQPYAEIEDTEPGYVKTKKELKQEEKNRARLLKEEERQIREEEKRRRKSEKRMVRTGGFVDEIEEDDDEPYEEPKKPVTMQRAASEAHEVLKKEIAAATSEEAAPAPKKRKASQKRQAKPQAKEVILPEEPEVPEDNEILPEEIKKMAIPSYSARELAEKAKRAGDAPDIVKDDITKVVLFDYSDIVGDDSEEE